MFKASAKGSSLIRMFAFTATLLLIPFTAWASGPEHFASKPAGHSAANQQADAVMDTALGHHSAPAEAPLHCHEKSPIPQATAPVLEPMFPDQPLLVIDSVPPPPGLTALPPNRSVARITIAGPPRFILFSNFRS